MTLVEGRIAVGLDEFMLRLGHITALIDIAEGLGGGRNRVVRSLSEWLTEPTSLDPSQLQFVGEYLAKKKLARVRQGNREVQPQRRARYDDFTVTITEDGRVEAIDPPRGASLEFWREDVLIADPAVPSKVGAVTVETRDTSNKSGVSHLIDWGLALGVLDNNLNPGSLGKVLQLVRQAESERRSHNPYVVSAQRLPYIWILFSADGDVLRQLLCQFPSSESLAKGQALALFSAVFQTIHDMAFGSNADTTAAATRKVRELRDDLGVAAGQEPTQGRASTMWHRLSSRLESLVDVGFLEKVDSSDQPRPYEYLYRLTANGRAAARGLSEGTDIDEWLLSHASMLAAPASKDAGTPEDISPEQYLHRAIVTLRSPAAIHIDSCALFASSLASLDSVTVSVLVLRNLILRTATERPDIARLARGHTGTRPEFVTFDMHRLTALGASGFVFAG